MLSAFNPNSRQLTPQEWQAIASESLAENNSQFLIIGSMVAGLFAASATGFPPTGLIVAAWGFYAAWKKTQAVNKNEEAISTYKCVAHVLTGDNLRDYKKQVGQLKVLEEMQFAKERGYTLSGDAEDFLETQAPLLLPPIPQVRIVPQPVEYQQQNYQSEYVPLTPRLADTQISNYTPRSSQEFDVIARMSKDLANHLIIGIQGSGKGIVVSNALDAIKKQHPNLHIFYIDPKGDEKETGYFMGHVDTLERAKIIDMAPEDAVKWVKDCFDKFQSIEGDKLLVLDEGTAVTSKFKNTKGALPWLKDKIVSYTSCGDSAGLRFWVVVQNAQTEDLGINAGLRSQLVPIVLINPKNPAAYQSVITTQLIPTDKRYESSKIMEIAAKSPVQRAIYHGGINEWVPMPKMQNFSGYDRDARAFVNEAKNIVAPAEKSPSQTEKMISMLDTSAETLLDAFIRNELKITRGDKKKEFREGIIKALKGANRNDLLEKFGLEE